MLSDLGMLFRAAPTGIENFTSAALAIAINHDARPMVAALRALEWPEDSPQAAFLGGHARPLLGSVARFVARTQVPLYGLAGVSHRYLDLVLGLPPLDDATPELWVEVKVDAPESGDQLTEYALRAALKPHVPAVITLARAMVRAEVAALTWSALCDAVGAVDAPHPSWHSFRDFLIDERIARPNLPLEPLAEPGSCIDVLVGVNRFVAGAWPAAGSSLAWPPHALIASLNRDLAENHRMVAHSGPLRFGLVPRNGAWHWWVAVSPKNYLRVPLSQDELVRIADEHGLLPQWGPVAGKPEVLERVIAFQELREPDRAEAWFRSALEQLRSAGVVDPYLARLRP